MKVNMSSQFNIYYLNLLLIYQAFSGSTVSFWVGKQAESLDSGKQIIMTNLQL